jgi:DNA-binding FadR family transcriptional regulator
VVESQRYSPIPRANLTEEIVRRVISLINDSRMKPGDKLPTERELIATFRVGRSSIREALKILSAIGVVRIVAGAGMFVGNGNLSLLAKPLSLGFLRGGHGTAELIEARRLLEVELAGLAAERGLRWAAAPAVLKGSSEGASAPHGESVPGCRAAPRSGRDPPR